MVLDQRIGELDAEIEARANSDTAGEAATAASWRGATDDHGIGGSGEQFTKGRHLAVSPELTPKQRGTAACPDALSGYARTIRGCTFQPCLCLLILPASDFCCTGKTCG